ncbi:MAG: helix-turn-helix domain-containing protein [Planctomycetota bacterium]
MADQGRHLVPLVPQEPMPAATDVDRGFVLVELGALLAALDALLERRFDAFAAELEARSRGQMEPTRDGRDKNRTPRLADVEPMLTVRDVARALNVDPKTIYRHVRSDTLPSPTRVGGLLRWNATEFRRWLEGQRDGSPHDGTR